ncbi:hypothetical protein M011DRAFT_460506 [Sporormia fimetaria CBS 119925]|uniref:Uncharacterized protein n=1 Tax=Sporormia fimetaria CBS 119925 TaxID=1340428 RepID=A0A6A6V546_9PLEO|nr:hypothetical protein M011DRAFT_460506 [Sporormia fimetaria CBS 119925]
MSKTGQALPSSGPRQLAAVTVCGPPMFVSEEVLSALSSASSCTTSYPELRTDIRELIRSLPEPLYPWSGWYSADTFLASPQLLQGVLVRHGQEAGHCSLRSARVRKFAAKVGVVCLNGAELPPRRYAEKVRGRERGGARAARVQGKSAAANAATRS